MPQLFRNNAFSALGASLTNVATTLTVTTGHGDRFPAVTAPDFFMLTLQDASNNIEIVRVTARTAGADSMTIQRAQEDTTARAWNIGDVVELRLTAFALNPLSLLEGSATAAAVRAILDVPTRAGGNASGAWGISISGNAATATTTTGNAGTATTLQTARNINGVSFNGSADITLPTVNTTGDQTIGGIKTFTSQIVASGGVQGNVTGNAATATALQTARTINGVSFNGSANITVTANTPNSLTFNNAGTGAASGATFNGSTSQTISHNTVGAPSVTGAGASGTWNIAISGNATTATTATTTTGNAGTATTLQTARNINGVSFNGSADITLPTVNTTGDQTIGGIKTFTSQIVASGGVQGNVTGNAATVTNGVYTTGDQTIGGTKTFTGNVLVTSNINAASYNGGQLAGMRNKIINGKMEIAQRGTSFAPANSYTLDRWLVNTGGGGVVTASQQADAPANNEFQNSLRATVTTVDTSIAAGDFGQIVQSIEGFNVRDLIGRTFTLSFWVRSSKTGIHCARLGNSAGDRSYVAEYTINAANTWEFKTITVSGGLITAGTWNWTNGVGLDVRWMLAAGSTFQTTAGAWQTGNFLATANQVNVLDTIGNIFAITGVQLEVGSVATPFEHRPFGAELALCQRYYLNMGGAVLSPCGTAGVGQPVTPVWYSFPVQMRASPTINVPASGGINVSSATATANALGIVARIAITSAGYGYADFTFNSASSEL